MFSKQEYEVCVCVCGDFTPGNQSGQTNIWMCLPTLAETASLCDIRTNPSSVYKLSVLRKTYLAACFMLMCDVNLIQ